MKSTGVVVWFTGLPGSGKSTISRRFVEILKQKYEVESTYVSMDEIRKEIFPDPKYTEEERDAAYRAFVLLASYLSNETGANVVLDGTGHRLIWRELARAKCSKFLEVYVKCPIQICIERETKRKNQNSIRKQLYLDAFERLKTGKPFTGLGKVPGVDAAYEESPNPETVLDSEHFAAEILAEKAVYALKDKFPEIFNK